MTSEFSLDPDLTVAQILSLRPETAAVFVRYRTGCVGCHLARFCTLKDVVRSYSLPMEKLAGDLRQCIREESRSRSGR